MEESSRLVVDSNFFIALHNPTDALHVSARELFSKLDTQRPIVVISNFIFLEIVTVLSQRVGRQVAVEAGQSILRDPLIRVAHIDEAIQTQSWEIFQKIEQKDISFVDCSTIAVMQSEDIDTLVTFDDDFRKLKKHFRFSLWGGKK